MTGPNVRLADPLKAEAAAYARRLGVSLNALAAVALREYLDRRAPPSPWPAPAAAPAVPGVAAGVVVAKVGRNDPCPCGSGKKYKLCHGGAA